MQHDRHVCPNYESVSENHHKGRVIFFGDVLGGLKIKWPMGRGGGGHVFRQVLGGGGQMCSIGLSFH